MTPFKVAESLEVSRGSSLGQNKFTRVMAPLIELETHNSSKAMVYIVLIWVKCVRCTVAINHEGRGQALNQTVSLMWPKVAENLDVLIRVPGAEPVSRCSCDQCAQDAEMRKRS